MTRQIILRSPPSALVRRQPLLGNSDYSSRGGMRKMSLAEVAGGTAADCAAVCCCCPCGLVNLLVLAVYKLPAGLCRKALKRNRHRRLTKKGGLPPRKCGCDEEFFGLHPITAPIAMVSDQPENKEAMELENLMWEQFYGAGFWRSPSQRSDHRVSGIKFN